MSYQLFPAKHFRQILSAFCLASVVFMVFVNANAQMGGIDTDRGSPGTGGVNIIDGRVFFPSGRMADRRIKIRLTSVHGADFWTTSDDSGAFTFRRMASGSYLLYVDAGNPYLPVTERVDIIQPLRRGGTGATYNVQIQLQLKPGITTRPGVVNAAPAAVPTEARANYETALKAAQNGDKKKAIELLKKAVELHPAFTLAYNELGLLYFASGEFESAAEALRKAVSLSPDGFGLRLNYGIALAALKRFNEAESEFRHAVQINKTSTVAHLYWGKMLIQLRHFGQAETALRTVLTLGGSDVAMAHRYLGALYNETGKNKLAIEALEKYLSLEPHAKDAESVRQIVRDLRKLASGS